ncbi:MAG: hypothetical protein Q9227_002294 [Pyrenula ochraceoflavens]
MDNNQSSTSARETTKGSTDQSTLEGVERGHPTTLPSKGRAQPANPAPQSRKNVRCRFFNTKQGCRAGTSCPFLHESTTPGHVKQTVSPHVNGPEVSSAPRERDSVLQNHGVAQPSGQTRSRPSVQKPVSKAQTRDPREYQINQLRRRYAPTEIAVAGGSSFTFKLKPTDPDFPFELDNLECTIVVPSAYPAQGLPSLKVGNRELDRGFQINVEKGFDALVRKSPNKTLLGYLNDLDRELEAFLTTQKAQTIKLVANTGKISTSQQVPVVLGSPDAVSSDVSSAQNSLPFGAVNQHTPKEVEDARRKRDIEVRQLEARLGRQSLFAKSADGLAFTIPVQFRKAASIPVSVQSVKTLRLFVPLTYNLEPCSVNFDRPEDENVHILEDAFEWRVRQHPEMTLMTHLNYFIQNATTLADDERQRQSNASQGPTTNPDSIETHRTRETSPGPLPDNGEPSDKPHVQIIPRPPEWTSTVAADQDSSDSYDSEEFSEDDSDDEGGAQIPENQVQSTPERGILLSFPNLELYGIELLEINLLSVTIRCDRCKTTTDVKNIKPRTSNEPSGVKNENCSKCGTVMSIGENRPSFIEVGELTRSGFRKDLMHTNSIRAGFLDLDGCVIVDLLPRFAYLICFVKLSDLE